MFRVNPKTGELTEQSIKQRQMIFAYAQEGGVGIHAIKRRLEWVDEVEKPKTPCCPSIFSKCPIVGAKVGKP